MGRQRKLNILFICSGNSFRSQIAEAWTRVLKGNRYNAYSAGIQPHAINPQAVAVMADAGIDISHQQAKHIDEIKVPIDVAVTVCCKAHEACPAIFGKPKVVHVEIEAPSALARQAESEAAAFACYRKVRDDIRAVIEQLEIYL